MKIVERFGVDQYLFDGPSLAVIGLGNFSVAFVACFGVESDPIMSCIIGIHGFAKCGVFPFCFRKHSIELKGFIDFLIFFIGKHTKKAKDLISCEAGKGFTVTSDIHRALSRGERLIGFSLMVGVFESFPFVE